MRWLNEILVVKRVTKWAALTRSHQKHVQLFQNHFCGVKGWFHFFAPLILFLTLQTHEILLCVDKTGKTEEQKSQSFPFTDSFCFSLLPQDGSSVCCRLWHDAFISHTRESYRNETAWLLFNHLFVYTDARAREAGRHSSISIKKPFYAWITHALTIVFWLNWSLTRISGVMLLENKICQLPVNDSEYILQLSR